MRKGVTLIELIFSMVIIAIVFTVVPKIMFASNKSIQLSIKEDALFNAYSLMGSILKLDWDENTTNAGKILDTDANDCNETIGYRIGGFAGSRNCKDTNDTASSFGQDGNEASNDESDDIDDYEGYDRNISVNGKPRYNLTVNLRYTDENYKSSSTDELKEINVTVKSLSKKSEGFKSHFFFYSTNLGHIQIKSEPWSQ